MAGLAGCAGRGGKISPDSDEMLPGQDRLTRPPGAGYSDLYVAADYGIFAKHGPKAQLVRPTALQLVAGWQRHGRDRCRRDPGQRGAILKGANNWKFVAMSSRIQP